MKFRQISIVLAGAIIVGGFLLNNYMASLKKDPEKKPMVDNVPVVNIIEYSNDTVANNIEVTGRLMARNSIQVISEVQGKYSSSSRKDFREGEYFKKGETMISIAPAEMEMDLKARKSSFLNLLIQLLPDLKMDYPKQAAKWESYIDSFDLDMPISELPEIKEKQLRMFLNSRNVQATFYQIKAAEITLAKYNIVAPFDGVVSASSVNPGMIIRPGQVLGSFINPEIFELEFALAEADLQLVSVGDDVNFDSPTNGKMYAGKVTRISAYIDPNTQTGKVFAQIKAKDLKEGMYVKANINARNLNKALKVPRKVLVGSSELYIVEEGKLKLQTVNILRLGADYAIISGLEPGAKILNQNIGGVHEGMTVKTRS